MRQRLSIERSRLPVFLTAKRTSQTPTFLSGGAESKSSDDSRIAYLLSVLSCRQTFDDISQREICPVHLIMSLLVGILLVFD